MINEEQLVTAGDLQAKLEAIAEETRVWAQSSRRQAMLISAGVIMAIGLGYWLGRRTGKS